MIHGRWQHNGIWTEAIILRVRHFLCREKFNWISLCVSADCTVAYFQPELSLFHPTFTLHWALSMFVYACGWACAHGRHKSVKKSPCGFVCWHCRWNLRHVWWICVWLSQEIAINSTKQILNCFGSIYSSACRVLLSAIKFCCFTIKLCHIQVKSRSEFLNMDGVTGSWCKVVLTIAKSLTILSVLSSCKYGLLWVKISAGPLSATVARADGSVLTCKPA